MVNLYDRRNDFIDIGQAKKVLWVYRGDDFESILELKIKSEFIEKVVFNSPGLVAPIEFTFVEDLTGGSIWRVELNKYETQSFEIKQYDFSVSIKTIEDKQLVLYKGILNVNNSVFSNNTKLTPLVSNTSPTITDNFYMIGTFWVNTNLGEIYVLAQVINDEAIWTRLDNNELIEVYTPIINDLTINKQDKLISGENLKTIGGESLLGSGNIPILGVEIDNATIVLDNEGKIKVSDDLKIDGGAF